MAWRQCEAQSQGQLQPCQGMHQLQSSLQRMSRGHRRCCTASCTQLSLVVQQGWAALNGGRESKWSRGGGARGAMSGGEMERARACGTPRRGAVPVFVGGRHVTTEEQGRKQQGQQTLQRPGQGMVPLCPLPAGGGSEHGARGGHGHLSPASPSSHMHFPVVWQDTWGLVSGQTGNALLS